MKSLVQVLLVSVSPEEADQITRNIEKGKGVISCASSVEEAMEGFKKNSFGLPIEKRS